MDLVRRRRTDFSEESLNDPDLLRLFYLYACKTGISMPRPQFACKSSGNLHPRRARPKVEKSGCSSAKSTVGKPVSGPSKDRRGVNGKTARRSSDGRFVSDDPNKPRKGPYKRKAKKNDGRRKRNRKAKGTDPLEGVPSSGSGPVLDPHEGNLEIDLATACLVKIEND